MKIQYLSDLHLGRNYSNEKVLDYVLNNKPDADVLVIAGDTASISSLLGIEKHNDFTLRTFITWCSDNFKKTIIVPGNHEFYDRTEMSPYLNGADIEIAKNVHIVSNSIINVDDVYFVCSTLWSNVTKENEPYVDSRMNDCRLISYYNKRFTASKFQYAHTECKDFLTNAFTMLDSKKVPSCKIVVVTHHCPLLACENPEHVGGCLSSAFIADDMEDLIHAFSPAYWVYGHTHYNCDISFGDTYVVSNQLGYSDKESERFDFDKFFYI